MAPSTILRGLRRLEEYLLALLLAVMILLSCIQIGLRLFFDSGIGWADPLLRYLVVWGGFLGAMLAVSRGKHISLDLSRYLLPRQILALFNVAIPLFSSAVCTVLSYASYLFIRSEMEFGNSVLLLIPSWGWNLIFPLAFAAMAIRFLIRALAVLTALLQRSGKNAGEEKPR